MGGKCTIRVVLLNGSTLRSSFSPEETIRKTVRPFIDTKRTDGDVPYTFKHLLTPSPSRSLTPSDEDKTLQSLGLVPSATLILVPIQSFTTAYRRDAGGVVQNFFFMLYAYLLAFFLTMRRYVRAFSGGGIGQQRVTPSTAMPEELLQHGNYVLRLVKRRKGKALAVLPVVLLLRGPASGYAR